MRRLLASFVALSAVLVGLAAPPAGAVEPTQAHVYAVVASPLTPGPVVVYQAAGWVAPNSGTNTAAAGQCSAEAQDPGRVVQGLRVLCWIEGNSTFLFGDAAAAAPVVADAATGSVWYRRTMNLCMRAYLTVGGSTWAYPIACGEFMIPPDVE